MKVQCFRTGRDDGNKPEGKTSRKEITSRSVHKICQVSIFCIIIDRDIAREIYQDSTVVLEGHQASDRLR